jgi:hypothetical protein
MLVEVHLRGMACNYDDVEDVSLLVELSSRVNTGSSI